MMEGTQSREELEANLREYRAQLNQVEELLLIEDQVNVEMQEMYNSLTEVIQLTEELLREAMEGEAAAAAAGSRHTGASSEAATAAAEDGGGMAGASGQSILTPPALNLPSILPASVADQIRRAQIRAALAGTAPAAWLVGAKVQALYADGQHYNAVVEGVAEDSKAVVLYEGYEERAEVALSSLRERPEEPEVYTGVAAPKRKRVEEQPLQLITEIPKWLQVKEGDDEKTVQRKKKLLKSYKSKMRFQSMDMQTKKKQDSWKDFVSGKATKKKAGFFTGHKKESIFAVPEGVHSKVGVVGSGKGMTQYQKVKRVDGSLQEFDS